MRVSKALTVASLLLALGIAGTGCSSGSSDGGRQIPIEMNEYALVPAEISVTAGEAVAFVLTNKGTMPHNFTIADAKIESKLLNPGESQTIKYTAKSKGNTEITCSVSGHKEAGMVGKLEVK